MWNGLRDEFQSLGIPLIKEEIHAKMFNKPELEERVIFEGCRAHCCVIAQGSLNDRSTGGH